MAQLLKGSAFITGAASGASTIVLVCPEYYASHSNTVTSTSQKPLQRAN